MSKFKEGDQVRVNQPGLCRYGLVSTIERVTGFDSYKLVEESSEHWHSSELELVTKGEEVKPYQRKTYKLIRDMPGYAKGTLFQEQCDDGTQPYTVMAEPGRDPYHEVRLEFKNRLHVEDNPKWFVEVFKVNPEYQTREELDQWEAFKKQLKPATKRIKRTVKNHGVRN